MYKNNIMDNDDGLKCNIIYSLRVPMQTTCVEIAFVIYVISS